MTLTARELAFLLVLVVCAAAPAGAQEESGAAREARERDRGEEERRLQQRQFDAHRFGAGGSDPFAANLTAVYIRRLNEFRSDLERFARQVVGVSAPRQAPMSEAWAEADLRERSGSLTETIDALLAFIDPGRPVPESDGAPRTREVHAARIEAIYRLRCRGKMRKEGPGCDPCRRASAPP